MLCKNCGKNFIRGMAFCLECGSPVPPEALEEIGLPGRGADNGEQPKNEPSPDSSDDTEKRSDTNNTDNAAESNSPDNSDNSGDVQAAIHGVSPMGSGGSNESLVFCPNCGMHMQSNPYQCNKCGMILSNHPGGVPLSEGGVPLMNIGSSEFGDPNSDIFGNGMISANDFAELTEQLANFSAMTNGMPDIADIGDIQDDGNVVESTYQSAVHVRQHETANGETRKVEDFSLEAGDEAAFITADSVPVIEDCSMDENPEADIDLNPYLFLNNSMDDILSSQKSKENVPAVEPPKHIEHDEHIKHSEAPAPNVPDAPKKVSAEETTKPVETNEPADMPEPTETTEPTEADKTDEPAAAITSEPPEPIPDDDFLLDEAPFIEETVPVIGEFSPDNSEKNADSVPTQHIDLLKEANVPETSAEAKNSDDTPNVRTEEKTFRCQYCGKAVPESESVCPHCGASYNGAYTQQPKKKSKALVIAAAAVVLITAAGLYVANLINGSASAASVYAVSDTINIPTDNK